MRDTSNRRGPIERGLCRALAQELPVGLMGPARQGQGHSRAEDPFARQAWRDTWRQALTALNIGWDLGLPLVGGTVLGHHLDGRWGTGYTYTLGGMSAGLFVGVYNIVHTLRRASRPVKPSTQPGPRGHPSDRPRTPIVDAESGTTETRKIDARLS